MKLAITRNSLLAIGIILVVVTGCDMKQTFSSLRENKVLAEGNPFDPNLSVAGVNDGDDARIPNLVAGNTASNTTWVNRCTPERYALERTAAINAAKANRNLIPVKFSILTGTLFDNLAYAAHRRTILRKDSQMKSKISVGPSNAWAHQGPSAFHYIVDHSSARANFISGAKCFFDTVSIDSGVNGEILNEQGQADHAYRVWYYGDLYGTASSPDMVDGGVSPRLFRKNSEVDVQVQDPQVVPLFVADLRAKMLAELGIDVSILAPLFASSAVRREEYQLGFKKVFDLKALWTHRDAFTQILSTDRVLNQHGLRAVPTDTVKRAYSAYEGVPQLVDWLVFSGLSATVMSTQYTPIVLDLGEEKIRTTSLEWGTFFNLAGLKQVGTDKGVSHMTAWLGGYVSDEAAGNSVVERGLHRVAEDGLLVVPNADGSVTGPQNLFGQTSEFANGFLTLAALAKKDCVSREPKQRYIGPWDGELYTTTLKVWIDRNRNGVAENGEVKSLQDVGVVAMNVCYILHAQNHDRFGNKTEYRATFLKKEAGEGDLSEAEILSRLASGKTTAGANASFRVMIDVFFNALPQSYLETVELADVRNADGSPVLPK